MGLKNKVFRTDPEKTHKEAATGGSVCRVKHDLCAKRQNLTVLVDHPSPTVT